jgi:hypothetical protein
MAFFERYLGWFQLFNGGAGLLTFLFIIGFVRAEPRYFVYANVLMKCFLAGWLIVRFGTKSGDKNITPFDSHACFVAGMYIILSSIAELGIAERVRSRWKVVPYGTE